ncbi:MAG: branched-chain-amino-acid transaminase [Candidatus Bathyarchaeia archaeon]
MTEKELITYVNGEFKPQSQAMISVFDRVVSYGDGVFDTMVCKNGYVFKLDEHIERLFRSAKAVKIDVQKTKEEVKGLIVEAIKKNGLSDCYVKIVVTRGVAWVPLMTSKEEPHTSMIIFVSPPVGVVSDEKIRKGAKLLSTTIKRSHPESIDPRIKSVNYQGAVLMRREVVEGGADEAVSYGYDGYVAEGGGDNIWIVKNGILMTPSHGVLEGITRETVIEIAQQLGYRAINTNINKYDLYQADEAFLSSTAGGIIPVIEIDRRPVGSGAPGPITKRIQERYTEMLEKGIHGTPIH